MTCGLLADAGAVGGDGVVLALVLAMLRAGVGEGFGFFFGGGCVGAWVDSSGMRIGAEAKVFLVMVGVRGRSETLLATVGTGYE